MITIYTIHGCKNVVLNLMLLQQPKPAHHLIERRLTAPIHPERVMQFPWTINAYANQEIVRFKKLTPLITEQRTISLNRILERHPWTLIFFLILHSAPEKVETHQGWFTPLPRDRHLIGTMGFNQLFYVPFKQLIVHAEPAARIKLLLIQVEAVRAL